MQVNENDQNQSSGDLFMTTRDFTNAYYNGASLFNSACQVSFDKKTWKTVKLRTLVSDRGTLWPNPGPRIEIAGVVDKTNNHAKCVLLFICAPNLKFTTNSKLNLRSSRTRCCRLLSSFVSLSSPEVWKADVLIELTIENWASSFSSSSRLIGTKLSGSSRLSEMKTIPFSSAKCSGLSHSDFSWS